ncbi:Uncharacterized protein dnm_001000 [Desulfonema magnum]|uniref:Uncharacterized protein n=1 Tax=Desulfonema magnum TaxID=45655 RepID=A0A975BEV3_9BACT|nr:Uncharacterized protein dnm_001000 [Desulfonema magnum]
MIRAFLVPTQTMGMPPGRFVSQTADRNQDAMHSHANHGNKIA